MGAVNEIFRDPTEGALARRRELVRERRDDLAVMPHAIRRVVVARRARSAASLAILGTAVVALAAPATALYLGLAMRARGWPATTEFEQALALHSSALLALAAVGLVAAVVMTRRRARLPRVAPIAAVLAGAGGIVAVAASGTIRWS